ncbi:MAG: hypothetical protein OXU20_39645 [Myxococcales bacterium]|nr:hypothetical protein [Myxococcales bacterium]MDD9969236.1 hypothetical protein [Myxococcales bacterium]
MDRRILGAGLVAGIVAACIEPGAELMGEAAHDAGVLLADAGTEMMIQRPISAPVPYPTGPRMLADAAIEAGRALQEAGRMMGPDAGPGIKMGGRDAQAQALPAERLPRPHWVLRDGDDTPLEAEVYPTLRPLRFSAVAHECVTITHMGQRHIGLAYRLATGKIDSACGSYTPADSWRDSTWAYFTKPDCTGQAYAIGGGWLITEVAKRFYYTDGPADTQVDKYYRWDETTETCRATTSSQGQDLWAFKEVPTYVVNLLDKPPYSLELTY